MSEPSLRSRPALPLRTEPAYRLGWLPLALACVACGSGGGEPPIRPGGSENPDLDRTTFEVEWREDVAVLDDMDAALDALVRSNVEGGELVFDAAYPGLAELTAGRSAMIGGIGIFRVIGRETTSEGEVLQVEEAPLTDVIWNGRIGWRRTFVSAGADARIGLGTDEGETAALGRLRQPLASYLDGKLTYSGEVAGFAADMTLEPGAEGIDLTLSAKYDRGRGIFNSAITATVHGLTNETDIVIEEGVIRTVDVNYIDVEGRARMEAGAVELGGNEKIEIPARMALPFTIGIIPFRIELGTSLEFSSTLVGNTSALFKGSAKFKGTAGARVDGEDVSYFASFDLADLTLEETDPFGTITSGLGIVLNFPELSLGVGVPRVASANAYLRFKTEVISNLTVSYDVAGIVPVITGTCAESGVNFGATLGGKAQLIGIDVFEQEEPLFGKLGEKRKTGNACEASL